MDGNEETARALRRALAQWHRQRAEVTAAYPSVAEAETLAAEILTALDAAFDQIYLR